MIRFRGGKHKKISKMATRDDLGPCFFGVDTFRKPPTIRLQMISGVDYEVRLGIGHSLLHTFS